MRHTVRIVNLDSDPQKGEHSTMAMYTTWTVHGQTTVLLLLGCILSTLFSLKTIVRILAMLVAAYDYCVCLFDPLFSKSRTRRTVVAE